MPNRFGKTFNLNKWGFQPNTVALRLLKDMEFKCLKINLEH